MLDGMPIKIIPKIGLIDWIKLICAVIIIYLWLALKVSDVWENVFELFQQDYLIDQDHQWYYEDDLGSHNIDYKNNFELSDFDSFCGDNKKICNKLDFKQDYPQSQKIEYLSGAIYTISWIDNYTILWKSIFDSFNLLTLQTEKATKRAWTRWNSVFVNTNNIRYDWEFVQLLVHEFGHIVDIYSINWASKKKDKNFTEFGRVVFAIDDPSIGFYKLSWNWEKIRKSSSDSKDFCSGYGMYNPFEDFAECHNLYLNHNAVFRLFARSNTVLKQKYNFMASLYKGRYFDKGSKLFYVSKEKWIDWRPWDTTRSYN
jgi:hypothetical protein